MLKHWLAAFRLRTLPLSLACIGMGSFVAYFFGKFDAWVAILSLLTTLFLQILSNLANDYGDSKHGADGLDRKGPKRVVQQGFIKPELMLKAIVLFSIFSFFSGLSLLYVSIGFFTKDFYYFLALGIASIFAAIAYTNGKVPYGYRGLGDIYVFVFFGLIGVVGTYYLHSLNFEHSVIFPAISCGLLATAVLNVNNIRDIHSDKIAGKKSIPVRIGSINAKFYQLFLIVGAFSSAVIFTILHYKTLLQFSFLIAGLPAALHLYKLFKTKENHQLDPLLKQLALTTLLFVLLFGFALALALELDR